MSDDNNVVSLNGAPPPGEIDQNLVDMLEALLLEAKNGELVAFAYAGVDGSRLRTRTGWYTGSAPLGMVLGGLHLCAQEIMLVWRQARHDLGSPPDSSA